MPSIYPCIILSVGERCITGCVHGLLHLPKAVENLGPLWAHSCFPFEAANGEMNKTLFHGTNAVQKHVHVLQSTK